MIELGLNSEVGYHLRQFHIVRLSRILPYEKSLVGLQLRRSMQVDVDHDRRAISLELCGVDNITLGGTWERKRVRD